MTPALDALTRMEYPGRLIILGRDPTGDNNVIVYGITGRSPPSQARRLNLKKEGVFVEPTDEKTLKTGNPELLCYPALLFYSDPRTHDGIAVSNGQQTRDIYTGFLNNPFLSLIRALSTWEYEPDQPNYTPRISGCVEKDAVLSIIKRAADGSTTQQYFGVPLVQGRGKLLTTYVGPNVNPLPSFEGEPHDVELAGRTAQETAEAVYAALNAQLRVGVAVLHANRRTLERDIAIINKYDVEHT